MAVQLTKTPKINLVKGQVINLTKDGTKNTDKLDQIYFGASWGKIKNHSVDLDASLFCYDKNKEKVEVIYYGNKNSINHSIHHSGDDLVGGKTTDADNETINIKLSKIDSSIEYIVATLNSYSGENFGRLPYVKARIYTGSLGDPDEILCSYDMKNDFNASEFSGKTAVVVGVFYRKDNSWKFRASGLTSRDTRVGDMLYGLAVEAINKDYTDKPVSTVQVQVASGTGNIHQTQIITSENTGFFSKIINFFKNL